jgi:two-component system osmolarity sensor histidine kinase EnvZ
VLANASPIAQTPRRSWFKSGLFWRTFLLLGLLTSLSMASWICMINAVQRGPQVKQTAELVSHW